VALTKIARWKRLQDDGGRRRGRAHQRGREADEEESRTKTRQDVANKRVGLRLKDGNVERERARESS
jgi:hypothetical protein